MHRSLAPLLLVTCLGAATAARAQDLGACCVHSTSRLDSLMNPVRGGDERFFTTPGGVPNILFILDTFQDTAQNWPMPWPSQRGCGDPTLNGLGYDPSTVYTHMWSNLSNQSASWFDHTKFYPAPNSGYGTNFTGSPSGPTYSSTLTACSSVTGISLSDAATCQQCLTSRGYYIHDATTRLVSGNFLNLYAPRDSGAALVLSQVVHDVSSVRMGIITTQMSNNNGCWSPSAGGPSCICNFYPSGPTCSKSSPLDPGATDSQRNSIINNLQNQLGWGGCGGPRLASLLYGGAHWFRAMPEDPFRSAFGADYATNTLFDEPSTQDKSSICTSCGFNAIVLLAGADPTDAVTRIALPSAISAMDVSCPGCPTSPEATNLPKLAKWLWENDLRPDYPGKQRVAVYTIGFSTAAANSALLRRTAEVGGGRFLSATNTQQLRKVMLEVVDDINSRSTAFSAPAITSMQTEGSALNAIVPRMVPEKEKPWSGELYRFRQLNEFVEGRDKNGDGDTADIFLVDEGGDIVTEEPTSGALVKRGSGGAAVPVWEVRTQLLARGHAGRRVLTVMDTNNDGAFTSADGVVEFSTANATRLARYLGVAGTAFCPKGTSVGQEGLILRKLGVSVSDMAALLGVTLSAPPTTSELNDLCVRTVIQYIRGQDLGDEDADGSRTDTRPAVLGDIFHSSPVVVDPPVDPFLCDLGLHTQCVRTLYSTQLGTPATPLVRYEEQDCAGRPVTRSAYASYSHAHRMRTRLVLVGSNGGMLHAIQNGTGTERCTDGRSEVSYTDGTGEELWAFIPPDLLPRLAELFEGHAYFVDGDTMVRDIWHDDNRDGQKQAGEFRTVAVLADGRGGIHYSALELRFDSSGRAVDPRFLWLFPQPCTPEAATFGKTLLALSPKPPPIGPVLLDSASTGLPGVVRDGVATAERWVVALSGGWSPSLGRGRGVYLVDAFEGLVNGRKDNLWWKLEYDEAATGEQAEPRRAMTHSVVAPISLVDYGPNSSPRLDGFFDTGVVGDTAGQLWVLRFQKPGVLDPTSRLIRNWSGARAFQQDRYRTTSTVDEYGRTNTSPSVLNRWPFQTLAAVALQPDTLALRAFVGTGDRYSILDSGPGRCRFDNPQACAKLGCGDVRTQYQVSRPGVEVRNHEMHWGNNLFLHPRSDIVPGSLPACGAPGTDVVTASFLSSSVSSCPSSGGSVSFGDLRAIAAACGSDPDNNFRCRRVDTSTLNLRDLPITPSGTTLAALGMNRFYGLWVYGGTPARTFEEDRTSASLPTANSALGYDSGRLTDRTSTRPTEGDLVNVTAASCTTAGCGTSALASGAGNGWVLDYPTLGHRTTSAPAVVGGCVLWNTMVSNPASQTCGSALGTTARFLQANYITGAPDCAEGFLSGTTYSRFQERAVATPPTTPTTVIQLSSTGQLRYSAMLLEPGKDQAVEASVSTGDELLQSVYELPVSRRLHLCRHESAAECLPQ